MVCKYFLTFCRFPFSYLFCCAEKLLLWCSPISLLFILLLVLLVSHLKITFPKPFSRSVFSKFNSSSFMLSGLPLKSLIHLKLTFMSGKDRGLVSHSFACEFVVFLTLFIEETTLLHWVFLAPCQMLVDNICMGLLLGSEFCCIGLCVCFYASTIFFWYPSFVIWFVSQKF